MTIRHNLQKKEFDYLYFCFKKIYLIFMNLDGRIRKNIRIGIEVEIVQKQDQRSGNLTKGIVKRILTNSPNHPHGIKVQIVTGKVGRVKNILSE